MAIFCDKSLNLRRSEVLFDLLNLQMGECLIYEEMLPLLENLDPSVKTDFEFCFSYLERNYLYLHEFEALCERRMFVSLQKNLTLSFDNIRSKLMEL